MPKRIVFPAKSQVALQDFELPATGPHDLKIRTLYSLMSIGTETIILHQKYAPDSHFARMFSFPQLKTGVQAVGEVEQVGGAVSDLPRVTLYSCAWPTAPTRCCRRSGARWYLLGSI